ncbi:MAG: hypothetical protein ABL903_12435 [Methylococcales bacterium]
MSDTQFNFEIKASKILLVLIATLHILAFIAALSNTLVVSVQFLLSGLILVHFGMQWQRYSIQIKPILLTYNPVSGWGLVINDLPVPIKILPSTIITPFMIIIYYQKRPACRSTESLVCFKDALLQSAYRQLFVQLKITGMQTELGGR